jgi:hypothetical protein
MGRQIYVGERIMRCSSKNSYRPMVGNTAYHTTIIRISYTFPNKGFIISFKFSSGLIRFPICSYSPFFGNTIIFKTKFVFKLLSTRFPFQLKFAIDFKNPIVPRIIKISILYFCRFVVINSIVYFIRQVRLDRIAQ